jgi:hypothetical protein
MPPTLMNADRMGFSLPGERTAFPRASQTVGRCLRCRAFPGPLCFWDLRGKLI